MGLTDFRDIVKKVFIVALVLLAAAVVFCLYNPYAFREWVERLLWVSFISGVIVFVLYFPLGRDSRFKFFLSKKYPTLFYKTHFPRKTAFSDLVWKLRQKLNQLRCRFYRRIGEPARHKVRQRFSDLAYSDSENYARLLLGWTFQLFLLVFILLLLSRQFVPGFTAFINANYLFLAVLFFGIVNMIYPPGDAFLKGTLPNKGDYIFIGIIALIGSIIIWQRTQEIGILSPYIAVFSGVLIFFLSVVLLEEG